MKSVRIFDVKTPGGKWLGAVGLRKLTGKTRRTWTIKVTRTIRGEPFVVEGTGPSLEDAIDDGVKKLDLLENSA